MWLGQTAPLKGSCNGKNFENKNYSAWKNLIRGKGRITQVINEQNFSKFAQMHQLKMEGKNDEASEIKIEWEFGLKNGAGKNQRTRNNRTSK